MYLIIIEIVVTAFLWITESWSRLDMELATSGRPDKLKLIPHVRVRQARQMGTSMRRALRRCVDSVILNARGRAEKCPPKGALP